MLTEAVVSPLSQLNCRRPIASFALLEPLGRVQLRPRFFEDNGLLSKNEAKHF